MKRFSGDFAVIFIDEADKPYSVFGTYQIFPAGTIGIPAKQYDSGQITYNVKDINNQKIITSFLSANLKISGDNWSIGEERSLHQWNSFHGEPFDTMLAHVKSEYYKNFRDDLNLPA